MKKRIVSQIKAFFLILVVLHTVGMKTYASVPIDLNKIGSLTLVFENKKQNAIRGIEVSMYQIEKIIEKDSQYLYELLPNYAGIGYTITDQDRKNSLAIAEKLNRYVKQNSIMGKQGITDQKGEVVFDDLFLGTYLVVQKNSNAAAKFSPFLISIPGTDTNGNWIYEVYSEPKTSVTTSGGSDSPDDTDHSDNPYVPLELKKPDVSAIPVIPESGEVLPQTGVLQWPVPVLSGAGLVLLILGWIMVEKNRKKKE